MCTFTLQIHIYFYKNNFKLRDQENDYYYFFTKKVYYNTILLNEIQNIEI